MADLLYPSSGWTPPVTNWYTFFTAGSPRLYTSSPRLYTSAYQRQQEKEREQQEKERENRRVAVKKAEALFLSCLTEKQKEQFAEDKTFKVTGSGGKNRYLIDCSSMIENVYLTKWGKPVIAYCAGPWRTNISWDFHLAQKLILESDEAAFLKVAVPGSV